MSKGASIFLIFLGLLAVVFIAMTFSSDDTTVTDNSLTINQTEEGNLPEYELRETDSNVTGYEVIQTEEGNLPDYEITGETPAIEPVEVAPVER